MTTENILRWTVIGGVFMLPFIPLLVAHSLFFPFITGKNFTFRIIIEVITAAWLGLAILNPRYRPRFSWVLATALIFVTIIGLADIFGANPLKSLWSNYERMEGWVTTAHLFLFLLVSATVLNTEKLWKYWWHTSIGVSVLIGLYGLLQLAGFITINQGGMRLDATFGNATYLGVYMLFHLFVTASMWARYAIGERTGPYAYGAIMFLQAAILFFTETRGAILGAIGGAMIAAGMVALFSENGARIRRYGVWFLAGIFVLVAAFMLLRDTALVRSINPLARLASISLSETTVDARFMNWGMAWQGFKERPILGWGQENYNLVFNKYYNPQMYAQEPWFDRVHDIIFDWLIAGGILGLLSYLAFFGSVVWAAWKSQSVIERGLLVGLLGGYFFYLIFTFDNITSYIMFFALAAYLASRTQREYTGKSAPEYPEAVRYSIALGTAILAIGSVWAINAAPLEANQTLIKAVQPQPEGPKKNIEYFEIAAQSGTFGAQEAREHLIQAAAQVASNPSITAEDKQKFYEVAEREMLKQIESAPGDARFPLFLGVMYDAFGQREKAKEMLEKAHSLSPNKQQVRIQLGVNALNRGDLVGAVKIFEETLALAPEYAEVRKFLGAALIRAGQEEKAVEVLEPLGPEVYGDQRIMGSYAAVGRYDKLVDIWEARVKENPQDAQIRFTLAAVYFQMGDKARAIQVLEAAARDIPESKAQADQIISEIKSGAAKLQ